MSKKKLKIDDLTPQEIVAELDKYIIGQKKAKRAVAIALRNRYRRLQLPSEIADDVIPKNILLIGPTGVGKTEIARRLAKLTKSPFIKVEASKFTEVGYVGRDVESIIRDLVRMAVDQVKAEKMRENSAKVNSIVEDRLLNLLLPVNKNLTSIEPQESYSETREKLRQQLKEGKLEERIVEIEIKPPAIAPVEIFAGSNIEELSMQISEMVPNIFGGMKNKKRRVPVSEARKILTSEEQNRLLDMDQIAQEAIELTEQAGIVFIDEIDKIAGRESGGQGPQVSREGVQRDLLPIIEGTTVNTRYGIVKTDHILFIGAGAFHVTKPSDLIPELQGRFPIRVELDSLNKKDFIRILTEPQNALLKQYNLLLKTENVEIEFNEEAIAEIASAAENLNKTLENIGARRLHTIMEKIMEEISFSASELSGQKITIDKTYVEKMLADTVKNIDLSKYIL